MIEMLADVKEILRCGAELTDRALERLLPVPDQTPASIHQAMRHSVFAGGKRLRPVLCIEAARMVAGSAEPPPGVEDLAAALEMLHTYSLIHDDLPALDNDDLRRGKPTCHVVYGEAVAILAGDALQTQAFETLAGLPIAAPPVVEIIRLIAQAVNTVDGMIGGQVLDLEAEHSKPTPDSVTAIHRAKTGALIRVSLASGAVYGASSAAAASIESSREAASHRDDLHRLTEFGRRAGLAFQIIDDVLDVTEDSARLGKTAGKDLASDKATWPAVFGIDRSIADAHQLIAEAFGYLDPYGERADSLKAVATYLVERKN